MHPLAEEYLKNKTSEAAAVPNEQEIRDFLLSEGLYEIEYALDDQCTEEFPLFDSGKNLRYRIVPIPVTYKEYIQLRNAREATREPKKCRAASHVQTAGIAVCLLGALLGGLYIGLAPLIWLATLISGTTLLALSKIISQLHQIGQQENMK